MQRGGNATGINVAILLAAIAGITLTLTVFYPGVMTYDAKYVYQAIAEGRAGDWQSPVMTLIWSWIDPIAPGAASMFLLISACYWLAFVLIAFTIAQRSRAIAFAVLVLAALPPAFTFVGIIWRDVFFAVTWLLAAALVFAVARRRLRIRLPAQVAALLLVALGLLLRPNAVFALPLIAIYVLWPQGFRFSRAAALYIPLGVAFYTLVPLIYYGALDAKRENAVHSIFVFDLGGISHFTKLNQFPVQWTPEQNALLIDGCYQPTLWDIYWNREPCRFVMDRLEGEKIFGSPELRNAWLRAVTSQPLAYLEHRTAVMNTLLFGDTLTLWTLDVNDPQGYIHTDRPAFMALRAIDEALKQTPVMRGATWLALNILILLLAFPRRETPAGAFATALSASAILYVLTFYAVGVATDFRYVYWSVLTAIAGGGALLGAPRESITDKPLAP